MAQAADRKQVVILGGGIAGAFSAKYLEDHADVVLIDPKDHLEIPYGQLRCIVEPDFAERSLVMHTDYLKKARHIVGFAENASLTEVVTSTGDILPYDYLVVTTGSVHTGPSSRDDRVKEIQTENKKIKQAKSALIIGGGPVGVELAGEIVTDFPGKKVVLAHSGDRLINFLGHKASGKALGWLRKKNVEVHLNDRVSLDSSSASSQKVYQTASGKTIEVDCHFVCIGKKVSSSWMNASVFKDALDESGRVKVDEFLRVVGHSNVFAGGDVTAIKEIKQGFLAQKHAEVIANNIKQLIRNPESKLTSYKPLAKPMGMVSLGRHAAVAEFPIFTLSGWIPGLIKSRDLFVGKTRKDLGLNS